MILVDTHVVLWLALEPDRISGKAVAVIEEARHTGQGLAISDMTLLEIAVIESKRRIQLSASLETFLTDLESRFVILPITGRICVRAMALPAAYPKDPADRIIGATALVEGISLVTADNDIRKSKALSHDLVIRGTLLRPVKRTGHRFLPQPVHLGALLLHRGSDSRSGPLTIAPADRLCFCKSQPPGRRRRLRPERSFL